jgi:MinD-like ATPase involved in chromosome partitioning or flagellar assembly
VAEQQDWRSSVLRDLGIEPLDTRGGDRDGTGGREHPPAPPPAAAVEPREGDWTWAPAPPPPPPLPPPIPVVPHGGDRSAPAGSPHLLPGPGERHRATESDHPFGEPDQPYPPVAAEPPQQPQPHSEPGPPWAGGDRASGLVDPESFTRLRPHRDPVLRRTGQRIRVAVGATASRAVHDAVVDASRLRQPVTTARRIAVASMRGGAGKTTVALLTATALAYGRRDRVVAVDADPQLGSLALRAGTSSSGSVVDFGVAGSFHDFAEPERYLGRTASGLWLVTGAYGAEVTGLTLEAYRAAVASLARFFAVVVTDCGAGADSSLNRGVLLDAHALALVTPATADGIISAHHALSWLRRTPAAGLLARTVVVLCPRAARSEGVDLGRGAEILASHRVQVTSLPYDRHLAAGARIEPTMIGEATRHEVIALAGDLLSLAIASGGHPEGPAPTQP